MMYGQDNDKGWLGHPGRWERRFVLAAPDLHSKRQRTIGFRLPFDPEFHWHQHHQGSRQAVLADLLRQAPYKRMRSSRTRESDLRGVSYEINAFMNYTTRKTERSVLNWVHKGSALGLKGRVVGPSDIYLIFDGDGQGDRAVNNYPDPNDNHGEAGTNFQMCDGSAKWGTKGKLPPHLRTLSGRKSIQAVRSFKQHEGAGLNRQN